MCLVLDRKRESLLIPRQQLYLVHWPVAFAKGKEYFPLVQGSTVEGGDCLIDDGVSLVDTWKGTGFLCPVEFMNPVPWS